MNQNAKKNKVRKRKREVTAMLPLIKMVGEGFKLGYTWYVVLVWIVTHMADLGTSCLFS